MNLTTYILIGITLMFLLEYFTSLKRFNKYIKTHPEAFDGFRFWERAIGILFWPILSGIFLYNFFKQLFK